MFSLKLYEKFANKAIEHKKPENMQSIDKSHSQKSKYQWEGTGLGLPAHVKGVPKGEGFTAGKIIKFLFTALKGLIGLLIAQFLHLVPFLWKQYRSGNLVFKGTADLGLLSIFSTFNNWENIDNVNEFFKPWTFLKKPYVATNWQEDTEFGHQRMCGINPALIRKCKQEDIYPNGNFRVTDELVRSLLGNDVTLASELADNRLYLLDYKIFERLVTPELEDELGRYSVAPLCLLYLNDEEQLVPIAIQLQPKTAYPDQSFNPIFTPQSPSQDWLAAKVAVASADMSYQGVISHLLNTHLIMEPFAISTFRQLSPQHILFQLLKPHFYNTFAINDMARGVFLSRGGLFDSTGAFGYSSSNELLGRGYSGKGREYQGEPWLFYQKALPYDLAARDVYGLPGYYYRDDALLIWEAIKQYVNNVLQLRYKVSDNLINDEELQAWKNEIIAPNYGNIQGLLSPEKSEQLTGNLNSLDDLIEIVTNIIFTATAHHSALNFGQYEYGAWVPNLPFAIYKPFSDLLGSNSEQKIELVERMPNRWQSIKQIILMSALSIAPPHTSKSLLTLENPFNNDSAQQAFEKFQARLQEIEKQISARNVSLSKPYNYLLPSRIAQSIAI
jgi:hypothetical protein